MLGSVQDTKEESIAHTFEQEEEEQRNEKVRSPDWFGETGVASWYLNKQTQDDTGFYLISYSLCFL